MKITIEYHGQLRHVAQKESDTVEVAENTPIPAIITQVAAHYDDTFRVILFDAAGDLLPSALILLRDEPVDRVQWPVLSDGDVLTLLPPIAGG